MSLRARLAKLDRTANMKPTGPAVDWMKLANGDPTWADVLPPPQTMAELRPDLVAEVCERRSRWGLPDPDNYDQIDLIEEIINLVGPPPPVGPAPG